MIHISPEIAALYNLDPELEAYDNSTLSTIDACIRKAYWKLLFKLPNAAHPGVEERVGIPAHFGSSIHAAMDKFYSPILVKSMSLEKRRIAAFRSASAKYSELITQPDLVDEKYSHPNLIRLLDDYFDHYESEDTFFHPIETELTTIVLIEDLDPPAYWISRMDGVVERIVEGDFLVREFKTTSSSLQSKLDELRISRQAEGYVWAARQFPSRMPIIGFMPDILAVRVRERDPHKIFTRDVFRVSTMQVQQWYRETLVKIRRWRQIQFDADLNFTDPLTQHLEFDRSTNECLRYGKCSYYDLCVYGLTSVDLQRFLPNDWNPLNAEKMEL